MLQVMMGSLRRRRMVRRMLVVVHSGRIHIVERRVGSA